jgi:hypothetical protein
LRQRGGGSASHKPVNPPSPPTPTPKSCTSDFSTDLAWNNFPVKFDPAAAGVSDYEDNIEEASFKLDDFSDGVKNYIDSLTTQKPFFKIKASSEGLEPNDFDFWENRDVYGANADIYDAFVDVDSQDNIISYNWALEGASTKESDETFGKAFGCYPKGSDGLLSAFLTAYTTDATQLNSYLTSFISQLTAKGFQCATLSTASSTTQGLEECLDTSASPRNDWGKREVDLTDFNGNGSTTDEAQAMTSIGFLCANTQCTAPMGYPYFEFYQIPASDSQAKIEVTLSSEVNNVANSTDSYSFPNTNIPDDAAPDSTAQDTWTTDLSACLENSSLNCLTPKFKYSDVFQFPEFILSNSIYQYQRDINFDIDYNSASNFNFSTSPHFFEIGSSTPSLNESYDLTPAMSNGLFSSSSAVSNNAFLDKYDLIGASLNIDADPSFTDDENSLDASLISLQEIPDSTFGHVFGLDPENTQYFLSQSSKDYYIDFGETSNADPSENEDISKYENELENDGFTCRTDSATDGIDCSKSFPLSNENSTYSNVVFQWNAANAAGSYFEMSWGWDLQ